MNIRIKSLLIATATLLSIQPAVTAQISLAIDSDTLTLVFSGSDTGNSENLAAVFDIATWQLGASSGPNEFQDISAGLITIFSQQTNLQVIDGTLSDGLRLILSNNSPGSFSSVQANSNPISYAGLSQPYRDILESFGGQTMLLDQGSGFSAIEVTVVPELSSFATITGVLAILFVALRRRAH